MSNVLAPQMEQMRSIAPQRARWTFPPLFMKELRASRTLLIAGLWTYCLMPALLDIAYMVFFEHRVRTSMIMWIIMVGLGWFYAIIVGAQVVCRDWGQPEERFLCAQPISASSIVWAKWWAGLITLFSVVILNCAWTLVLSMRDAEAIRWGQNNFMFLLVFCVVLLAGYSIAFAAAFFTRQSLTSVLAAVLIMVAWWVAPWLSHRLNFLQPMVMDQSVRYFGSRGLSYQELIGIAFTCGVFFVIFTTLFVALRVARRESSPRIGAKTMAWTVAGGVLLVFTMAMNEVGSSLSVRDQRLLPPEYVFLHREQKTNLGGKFTSSENAGFILAPRFWNHMPAARIQLSAKGKIEELLTADFWPVMSMPERSVAIAIPECSVSGPDRLNATIVTSNREGQLGLVHCQIHWPAAGKPSLVTIQKRSLPADLPREVNFVRGVCGEKYVYLLLNTEWQLKPVDDQEEQTKESKHLLFVYDRFTDTDAAPAYTIPMHGPRLDMVQIQGKLAFTKQPDRRSLAVVGVFEMNDPASILSATTAERMPVRAGLWDDVVRMAVSNHGVFIHDYERNRDESAGSLIYDDSRHLLYFSERDIFGVADETKRLLGLYHFSIIGSMFRSWRNQLQLIPGQRVLEVGEAGLSVYDVSDEKQPRRTGFFNIATPGQADVYALGDHLLLFEGRRLSVLGLPK